MKDKLRIIISVVIIALMLTVGVLTVVDTERARSAYSSAAQISSELAESPEISGVRSWLGKICPALFSGCQPKKPAELWEYELLEDGTVCITAYNGSDTDLTIPAQLDGYQVTAIGDHALAQPSLIDHSEPENNTLESVTIPEGVTTIGDHAFKLCSKLRTVKLPESLTTIGGGAFSYCELLSDISIPANVTDIGVSAFYYCTNITAMALPKGMTEISDNLFGDCWNLSDITLPEHITYIGCGAFFRCYALESMTLPESVAIISDAAFSDCTSLQTLTIINSEAQLGYDIFAGANSEAALCAVSGSTTQAYAEENGISFVIYTPEADQPAL